MLKCTNITTIFLQEFVFELRVSIFVIIMGYHLTSLKSSSDDPVDDQISTKLTPTRGTTI